MSKKPFYITTPIYYPSGDPHIGHCYTTVACDSIARYKRMQGYDVMFLTGTDEHGLKIEQKAAEANITPKEYVDGIVAKFKALWKYMNISYDRYIRTTDDYHVESVQKIFKELYDKGYIYKGEYSGKYCTPCESFWTDSQLVDGKCPECGSTELTEPRPFNLMFNTRSPVIIVFIILISSSFFFNIRVYTIKIQQQKALIDHYVFFTCASENYSSS